MRGIIILCDCGAEKKAVPGINELPCQGRGRCNQPHHLGNRLTSDVIWASASNTAWEGIGGRSDQQVLLMLLAARMDLG